MVTLETSKGSIVLELDDDKAPGTVGNFLKYVDAGFYDGTIFHRVINNFMVQGGAFVPGMAPKPGKQASIKNEADNGLKNDRGTISMARTSDPHSASSQFFINQADNDFLNYKSQAEYGYAVFGAVVDGIEVIDAIATTPTGANGKDVPDEDVQLIKAYRTP